MIVLSGNNITWFLPKPWKWIDPDGFIWHDIAAERRYEGAAASGLQYNIPGIALPNDHQTLRGWWRLNLLHLEKSIITRQVDVGPRGGIVDLNAVLAYQIYKRPDNVERGPWNADYLGQTLPDNLMAGIGDINE